VRGDGQLATLPTNGGGGGASVSYYLNGSINQGTIGGVTYYEMNKTPIIGAGTDFTTSSNGYIASFLTDANDPALLNIPAGNFNFETYFEASSGGGSPTFYIELYKYDGTNFTLIASNSTSPKLINDATNIEAYFSALAVPQTTLTLTDRLAIRIYVTTAGRTITLHTENNTLCQVITTFTTGLTALNGLTAQVQYLATGTSGTDFNIASASATHTFNLPTASATNRGALASADWTTFNNKQNALTLTTTGSSGASTLVDATLNIPNYTLAGLGGVPTSRTLTINGTTFDLSANRTWSVGTVTSVAALTIGTSGTDLSSTVANGTTTPVITLNVPTASATNRGALSSTDWTTFNNKQNALTNPITGISASGRVAYFNGDTSITGSSNFFWDATNNRLGIGLNNPQRTLEIHNATADSQLRISGAAPSVSLGEAITGAIYQAKFGLITANGQYVTGGVAGDFVMISQTGATIFATSSTEKMRVQASGNVSIGNTNDTFRLDVTGTLRATGAATFSSSVTALSLDVISSSGVGSSTASGLARFITAGTTTGISVGQSNSARRLDIFSYAINVTGESFFLSTQSAHSIIFETNTAERMRINSVGDLLFAGSTTTSNQALITNDASFLKIYASNSSAPSKGIAFHYSNGSQTPEAMRITSGGVLKIGNGGTADDGLNPGYKNVAISFNNSQNRGEIQAVQQGLLVYPLILNGAGGNVGIGTYNPSQRLSVRSADNTSATNIARFAAENNTLAIGIGYETIRQTETGGSLFFETNGSPRMIITSGGNVEVRNQLHVGTSTTGNFVIISDNQVQRLGGGTLFINNSSTGDVSININGGGTFVNGTNGYGRAVTNSSDERIKKNIVTIDNALEKVIKMNGVYYEFNSQNKLGVSVPSEQKRIGLIAQQIEPILPEAVFTPKEANAPKSIDYSGMIGLLINAIQEQQQQIEQLKNK
jgi:hypothetical protein